MNFCMPDRLGEFQEEQGDQGGPWNTVESRSCLLLVYVARIRRKKVVTNVFHS